MEAIGWHTQPIQTLVHPVIIIAPAPVTDLISGIGNAAKLRRPEQFFLNGFGDRLDFAWSRDDKDWCEYGTCPSLPETFQSR